MPDAARVIISIVLSATALLLFVVLYSIELRKAWRHATTAADPINDKLSYVATAVAGLVAAIVATALSLPVPQPPVDQEPGTHGSATSATTTTSPGKSRPTLMVLALGNTIAGRTATQTWKEGLAIAYAIAYILIGAAAIVTWVVRDPSSLIKTQALTFFGLLIAAAKSFLS